MDYVICPVSEFSDGSRRIVSVGGRGIAVFRVGDEFYAVRNRCPHQGGPLGQGQIQRRLRADAPGEVVIEDGPPFVVCPWHGWQYDAITGEAYAPNDPRVCSYPVSVGAGGEIAAEPDCDVTFVAETFPVSVEDEYVVLSA